MLLYSCILSILTLGLVFKLIFVKTSLREIGQELTLILIQDTNRSIGISSRDKELRKLVTTLNEQLSVLQRERHRYQDGDRELKEAVTNISHDLRTPLTAISGYLELLNREQHSPQTKRCLEIIRNRVDSMKQLTEELFRYSLALTAEKEQPEPLSLNTLLEECLLSFYETFRQKEIVPTLSFSDTPVIRNLDKSAISRIFNNIISNAAKYCVDDFCVTLNNDGSIVFSNNAPNLSPVAAARLFDRFYTVENLDDSTGLGLSIAKQLTERMGGLITSEYKEGQLVITVIFPKGNV
ncbi:MAG: HAMP domain-containing histidine kinase [Acetatifactor sp.]|nr:HAMP domain-containing histidine kinase [Acetatifactor sp.]